MQIDECGSAKAIQRNGISVRIRPTSKNGVTRFVLDCRNQGRRELVWPSSMEDDVLVDHAPAIAITADSATQ